MRQHVKHTTPKNKHELGSILFVRCSTTHQHYPATHQAIIYYSVASQKLQEMSSKTNRPIEMIKKEYWAQQCLHVNPDSSNKDGKIFTVTHNVIYEYCYLILSTTCIQRMKRTRETAPCQRGVTTVTHMHAVLHHCYTIGTRQRRKTQHDWSKLGQVGIWAT